MARTDLSKPPSQSIAGFILTSDTPGYSCTEVWDKLGQRTVQNVTLEFSNVEIPEEDVIGTPGNALAEGTHALYIKATDIALNESGADYITNVKVFEDESMFIIFGWKSIKIIGQTMENQ